MPTMPSKYALNRFEVATQERFPPMSDLLSNAMGRLTAAAGSDPAFQVALAEVTGAREIALRRKRKNVVDSAGDVR